MPRPILYAVAAALLLGLLLGVATRCGTDPGTLSKKQARTLEGRARDAEQEARTLRAEAQRWEDTARYYEAKIANEKPIVLDSAGVVRLRQFWAAWPGKPGK